jgi:O-acetyl-ADP-ribose deacetylase (regulator of RNase III)
MALCIIKDPAQISELTKEYTHPARVNIKKRTAIQRFLGSRSGLATVKSAGREYVEILVRPPVWQGGKKTEWQNLRDCYEQVLNLVREHRCDAVVIPLLAAEVTGFPASIDFKIAVETIQSFVAETAAEVFLISGSAISRKPDLRRDVEQYLSAQEDQKEYLRNVDRFPVPEYCFGAEDTQSSVAMDPAADFWDAYDDSIFDEYQEEPCQPMPSAAIREEEYEPMDFPEYMEDETEDDLPEKYSRPKKSAAPKKAAPLFRKETGRSSAGMMLELDPLYLMPDAGFSETLLKLIDKSGKKDSEIYNRANVSRQHFSKIRNNPDYRPTKPTAIAFAIALELDLEQTEDLIGRAGYCLTRSSRFDLIIMYFLQRGNYNMFEINETLYEFDQSLLGA